MCSSNLKKISLKISFVYMYSVYSIYHIQLKYGKLWAVYQVRYEQI